MAFSKERKDNMNLIVDNHKTAGNSATDALAKFMSGEKVALDADFKEEDHPRGGEGSGKGGQCVKSNATVAKEDDLGSPSDTPPNDEDPTKIARKLGYLGKKEGAAEWLADSEGKKRLKDYNDFLELAEKDDAKAQKWFNNFGKLSTMWGYSDKGKAEFSKELGDSRKAKDFISRIEKTQERRDKELSSYYKSERENPITLGLGRKRT